MLSSLPKSGTILTVNILKELIKKEENFSESVQKEMIKDLNCETSKVSFGAINKANESEVLIDVTFHDENDAIYAQQYYDVTQYIEKNKNSIMLTGHLSPENIMSNAVLRQFSKKIYVTRYGLDVLNSKMKFLENLNYIYALNKSLNDYEKYKKLRYSTPDKIMEVLDQWERYSLEYIKFSKDFYIIKYETLLENPIDEIKKLASYLEIQIDDSEVIKIIEKLFFKELKSTTIKHKFYRHYNKSKKTEEWKNYIPYSFYQDFEKKYAEILEKLEYKTTLKEYETTNFHKIFLRKFELFQEQKNGKSFLEICSNFFIETLNKYLKNKKIAVYTDGNYGNYLIHSLNATIEIVLICSDNYKEITGIVQPEKLLSEVLNYDYILIAAHSDYTNSIQKQIEKILRRHGGVEIIDGFNNSYYKSLS